MHVVPAREQDQGADGRSAWRPERQHARRLMGRGLPYREACRKADHACEYEGGRSANVSEKVSFLQQGGLRLHRQARRPSTPRPERSRRLTASGLSLLGRSRAFARSVDRGSRFSYTLLTSHGHA